MPVMDGLQATRIIRSFEETGNWDAAVKAGIEPSTCSSDSLPNGHDSMTVTKRVPIIAVSTLAPTTTWDLLYVTLSVKFPLNCRYFLHVLHIYFNINFIGFLYSCWVRRKPIHASPSLLIWLFPQRWHRVDGNSNFQVWNFNFNPVH